MSMLSRWFEEVWNKGSESAIDEMSGDNVVAHGLRAPDGSEVHDRESFKTFYRQFRSAFSDIHMQVEETVSEGDLTVARCVFRARHTGDGLGKPATGKPVEITGMTMARVQDGKIVEAWNNFDFMTLFEQIE